MENEKMLNIIDRALIFYRYISECGKFISRFQDTEVVANNPFDDTTDDITFVRDNISKWVKMED